MRAGEEWLRAEAAVAPADLLALMVEALPAEAASVPDALCAGALRLYGTVLGGRGRETALPLLAADALFTHAFQAQAELEPGGLAGLAERWGAAGRLAELHP